MAQSTRREAMRRFAGFALLPVAFAGLPAGARANPVPNVPPSGNFVLRRRVVRSLFDGRELVVERDWECRFGTGPTGLKVTSIGQKCEVSAPEGLEQLARMEQQRKDAGPFPAELDLRGMIVTAESRPRGASRQALELALSRIDRADIAPGQALEARRFLTGLASAAGAAMSAIPPDLFFPEAGESQASRAIILPDGSEGLVDIRLIATTDEESGLLDRIERLVTTRIEGEARHSGESWSMRRI